MDLKKLGVICIGNFKNAEELLRKLREEEIDVCDYTKPMLSRIVVEVEERNICLTGITSRELGFDHGGLAKDIFEKAGELGLEKCFSEVGVQMALQRENVVFDGEMIISMDPIPDRDGDLSLFLISDSVDSVYKVDTDDLDPDTLIVFIQSNLQTADA